jgi:hypothetical protein
MERRRGQFSFRLEEEQPSLRSGRHQVVMRETLPQHTYADRDDWAEERWKHDRRLMRGNSVVAYDRDAAVVSKYAGLGAKPATDLANIVKR